MELAIDCLQPLTPEWPVCAVHIQVDAAEAVTGSAIAKMVHLLPFLLLNCLSLV